VNEAVCSPATAEALEFPALLRLLAALAATDLGRARALALLPYAEPAPLAAHRRRCEQTARLLVERRLIPAFELPPGELLERLDSGRPAPTGADLTGLAALLRASREAAVRVLAAEPPCRELAAPAAALPDLAPLIREIEGKLDRRGEVRDDATPELAAHRRRIRGARDQIYQQLGGYVGEHRDELGEETIPMRGGRLVLVLQAGSRGRLPGLLHGRSGTGRSFYFEPLEVVESNNDLQQAVEDEAAERQRIVHALLAAAQEAMPAIAAHADFVAELDLQQAACRLAEQAGAQLADEAPRHELRLVGARHPLLDPHLAPLRAEALGHGGHEGTVVPLDAAFDADSRILVVTGPNAGGKTVALKTVGLLALASQCGLPVPVEAGSAIPFFHRLVATVGDEQDLMSDRSTFSGRLLRLREAWEAAGPDSLLLIDELGSGTDPEEGSALGVALLEGLLAKGCLAVITTHLTQVAAAALEAPGAGCAAMEFEPATGRPSFRLVPGPPGGSEALALARRLGLPAEWLDRAEARLGREHRDLRRLIAEVERVRGELLEAQGRAEREAARVEALAAGLVAERDALIEERRAVGRRLRGELEAFRRETLERLRGETERIRGELEAGRKRGLAAAAAERLFAVAPELAGDEPAEDAGPLEVGARVRHRGLGWEGTLEKLERGRAEVAVKGKRVRCRADELVPAGGGSSTPAAAPPMRRARRPSDLAESEIPHVAGELKLIGRRVEPALEELDGYLDRALLAGRGEVRVVHGHGSGRLRQAVREHLRSHRAVAGFRPGQPNEGGDGATVVTLRGG
jgi:DNA mismatch repair protein MutS2